MKKRQIQTTRTVSVGGAVCVVVIGNKNGLEKAALVLYDTILVGCDLQCTFGVLKFIAIIMYHFLNPVETTRSIKILIKQTGPTL